MGGTTAKACLIEGGVPMVGPGVRGGAGVPVHQGQRAAAAGPGHRPDRDRSRRRLGRPDRTLRTSKVGPESAGADPGPACYGQGGTQPTVTDADLLLGYLNPDFFLGGEMRLDVDLARQALDGLAAGLGLTALQAAAAVHRVVNENMASAARMHAVERGRDLRRFAMVATGGAGPVHAWGVAGALDIGTVIFPPSAGVASALGMLTANPGFEFARSLPRPTGRGPLARGLGG